MTSYTLQVTSRALAGREEDYDRWYADVHMGEVLALPGFVSGTRYRQLGMDGQPTGVFVVQYAVETDDPAALLQSLFAASATMRLTDAIDPASPSFTFLSRLG